jgi:hypothetical protein
MAIQNTRSFSRATVYPTASTTMTDAFTTLTGASFLVVAVSANKFDLLAITGITFNGVAMTQGATSSTSGVQPATRIWYLASPPVGAFNVVVTTSSNSSAGAFFYAAWDGMNASGTPTGAGTENASATTISPTVTVGANDVAVMVASALNGGTHTAGSGTTSVALGVADANGGSGKGSFGHRTGAVPAFNFSVADQVAGSTLVLPGVAVSDLSGNVTLSDFLPNGSFASSGSDLSGNVTMGDFLPSGSFGLTPGSYVIPALTNWNGSLQTSVTVSVVTFQRISNGTQVLVLTSQTTNGSGDLSGTSASLVAGVAYMACGWNVDGSQRFALPITAT